jgi:hypothetical protein
LGTDPSADLDVTPEEVTYCARHPTVETTLACGRCATMICPRCLVQTPVGARCPDCARANRIPALELNPMLLSRGIAAAVGVGAVTGAAWGFITGGIPVAGIFTVFIALGMGWAFAEAISSATRRRYAPSLKYLAIVAAAVAYMTRNLVIDAPLLPSGDIWGYATAGISAIFAYMRLSR